jgi:1-deoxy-D-xylulose-5-phosphate reductoisomerase
MKGIALLGSTGSIGTQTLSILSDFPGIYRVVSLSAGKNISLLKEQIKKFQPEFVSVQSEASIADLKKEFPNVTFSFGQEGNNQCVSHKGVEIVIMGIVGFAALSPTLEAIRLNKKIGLANKESLVVAGALMKSALKTSTATLIPVDSEHNALYQLLMGRSLKEIASIVLTASGGPLLKRPELPLKEVTPEIAVKHPNWNMGPKISVDSATLMNKGLELIEAHYLFDTPEKQIEVWVHPQSIIHGAVWFTDNTCLAQLNKPDMRASIGFSLSYPERLSQVIPKLSLSEMARLEFQEPDEARFPCLRLAREALRHGETALVYLNATNEIAVQAFLDRKILFPDIPSLIERVLTQVKDQKLTHLSQIYEWDKQARELATGIIQG